MNKSEPPPELPSFLHRAGADDPAAVLEAVRAALRPYRPRRRRWRQAMLRSPKWRSPHSAVAHSPAYRRN